MINSFSGDWIIVRIKAEGSNERPSVIVAHNYSEEFAKKRAAWANELFKTARYVAMPRSEYVKDQ